MPDPMRSTLRRPVGARLQTAATGLLLALPTSLSGQWDAPVQPHRAPLAWGQVTADVTGVFRSSDARLGGASLADGLVRSEANTLFDTSGRLASALSGLGVTDAPLVSGGVDAAIQRSETELPLTLRAGLPWGFEMEATMRFVRPRLEADTRLIVDPGATLGRSPALDETSAVQTFVDEILTATEGFSADGRDWGTWGASWLAAYRASVLFPVEGSAAATQLLDELATLNAALVADGRTPVAGSPLFAAVPLDTEGFRQLTAGAPYGLLAFSDAPYIWRNGDVDVVIHRGLLGAARRGGDGAAYGVRASGGVRLPFAQQADPDLPFAGAAGAGVFAVLAGGDGWVERGNVTLHGTLRATLNGSREVVRRIGPVEDVFIGSSSRTGLEWTPGRRILGHLRAEYRPAGSLRLGVGWTFDRRGEDTYDRLGPPQELAEGTAFPEPAFFTDPALLELGTGGTAQIIRGGFRWEPIGGGFGVSVDVARPVGGAADRLFDTTELRLRGYRTLTLWD